MARLSFEKLHIEQGLSAEDLYRCTGFEVNRIFLSEHPHWEKVENQITLSEQELNERISSLRRPLGSDAIFSMSDNALADFAKSDRSSAVKGTREFKLSLQAYDHFNAVTEQGTQIVLNPPEHLFRTGLWPWNKRTLPYIYPGALDDSKCQRKLFKAIAGFIVRPQQDLRVQENWLIHTALSADRLIHFPKSESVNLLVELHEARHFVQLAPSLEDSPFSYFQELDADLFAHVALRESDLAQESKEVRRGWTAGRYLRIFSGDSGYWIAGALESFLQNKRAPKRDDVVHSILELHLRLVDKAYDLDLSDSNFDDVRFSLTESTDSTPDSSAISDATDRPARFNEISSAFAKASPLMRGNITRQPEVIYTLLREIVTKNEITNPLSHDIATKILQAAEYFGGKDLTHAPNVRQQIILPEYSPA